MLCQGIIRPNALPFSTPVLLIYKKEHTCQFCVDYHALNTKTVKDKFAIPVVDELKERTTSPRSTFAVVTTSY
jgi:putative transposase